MYRDDIHQISVALEKIAKKYLSTETGGGDMGGVNIYPGDVGAFITTTLKHKTIEILLPSETTIVEEELIPCPEGKRIAILGGRVGSKEKVRVTFYNGSSTSGAPPGGEPQQLDRAFLPTTNYILPPTNITLPLYLTSPGRGLWMEYKTLTANTEERMINGFLKFVYVDV